MDKSIDEKANGGRLESFVAEEKKQPFEAFVV